MIPGEKHDNGFFFQVLYTNEYFRKLFCLLLLLLTRKYKFINFFHRKGSASAQVVLWIVCQSQSQSLV